MEQNTYKPKPSTYTILKHLNQEIREIKIKWGFILAILPIQIMNKKTWDPRRTTKEL